MTRSTIFSSIWDHGTKSSVSVSHAFQRDDRGPFGLRQDGVHYQVTVGSPRAVRDPARTHLLLLRILARRVQAHEAAGRPFSRRDSRFGTLTRVVSQKERRTVGLGRSHGGRRQRQTGTRSLHQTFPSPEHHGPLLVSRHLPTGQIRQEHLPQRSLHRQFQEPARSVGYAQSPAPSVPHPMARRARHFSTSHRTSFRVPGLGSPSQE